ncbi:MAG: hypothetical protein FJ320_06610 [SAR202 cluster bacterium]|nr:hypothetical protein [SAR202 cluster bacterium]
MTINFVYSCDGLSSGSGFGHGGNKPRPRWALARAGGNAWDGRDYARGASSARGVSFMRTDG